MIVLRYNYFYKNMVTSSLCLLTMYKITHNAKKHKSFVLNLTVFDPVFTV